MAKTTSKNKRRIILIFFFFCIFIIGLTFRVGWIQVVANEQYAKLAAEQQTRDMPIPAKRGIIYDRNGKELAISAVTNTIWVRPGDVQSSTKVTVDDVAKSLSDILSKDITEIKPVLLNTEKPLLKVAKYVSKEKADQIREAMLPGISIVEDVKRYYPLGAFAAHILGSTTDDNRGLAGIELKYDRYLSGVPGRSIRNTDVSGKNLSYGTEKYFQAENGYNAVLTIDEVIQHYVEKAVEEAQLTTGAKQVMCIVMQPDTGDILAMSVYPDFDPNDPRTPLDPAAAAYLKTLNDTQKQDYWNSMWRNPLISDTYEPGSVLKLITTAVSLEEGLTNPTESFFDTGFIMVGNQRLRCDLFPNSHGNETLTEAVANSCNPVFVQLSRRIGMDRFYRYLEAFGFTEKTGVDFPGEGQSILQNPDKAGSLGLATMSYGQGISITPIQIITAISAIGNGGKLMLPRFVKELQNDQGEAIQTFEPRIVRQVISKETSEEMKVILESVVEGGTGTNAQIAGYRIGGKTGTADKVINGIYSGEVYASFIALAPIDDPELAILLIVDEPQGIHFGSQTAAPAVRSILDQSLRYLKIQPSYTPDELAESQINAVLVPEVTGLNYSEGAALLQGAFLGCSVWPENTEGDFVIIDQYPKAGASLQKGESVFVYKK
jgi:stage V sporulation protein D (sporulation-specific penicillin-binding protein)